MNYMPLARRKPLTIAPGLASPAVESFPALPPLPGPSPEAEATPPDIGEMMAMLLRALGGSSQPLSPGPMPPMAEEALPMPTIQATGAPISRATEILTLLTAFLTGKENRKRTAMELAFKEWQIRQGLEEKALTRSEATRREVLRGAVDLAQTREAAATRRQVAEINAQARQEAAEARSAKRIKWTPQLAQSYPMLTLPEGAEIDASVLANFTAKQLPREVDPDTLYRDAQKEFRALIGDWTKQGIAPTQEMIDFAYQPLAEAALAAKKNLPAKPSPETFPASPLALSKIRYSEAQIATAAKNAEANMIRARKSGRGGKAGRAGAGMTPSQAANLELRRFDTARGIKKDMQQVMDRAGMDAGQSYDLQHKYRPGDMVERLRVIGKARAEAGDGFLLTYGAQPVNPSQPQGPQYIPVPGGGQVVIVRETAANGSKRGEAPLPGEPKPKAAAGQGWGKNFRIIEEKLGRAVAESFRILRTRGLKEKEIIALAKASKDPRIRAFFKGW